MYNRIYVKGRSMSIKKKRLLTLAGIIAFAALIIALYLFAVKQRDANTSGDFGTIQYTTLGTIQEMDLANGIVTVRIHGEDEDYNYEYKRVLHYLEDEQLDLEFDLPDTECAGFEEGDVLAFHYFATDEDERPLPAWSAEVLGKENPNSNNSRLNFVSAEGEILSIENENPCYMVVMAELENIGKTEITLKVAWTLPEPGEYYEEGQKIRFYYEPPRENRIPGSVYIGSYEEQIVVLE